MSRIEVVDVDLGCFGDGSVNDEELRQRLEDIRDGYKNEDPQTAAVVVGQGAMRLLGIADAQNAIGFELPNTIVHPGVDVSDPEIHRLGIEIPGNRHVPQRPVIFESTRDSTRYEMVASAILPESYRDAGERYENACVVVFRGEGETRCYAKDVDGGGQQNYLKWLGHFAGSILEVMNAPKIDGAHTS